MPDQTIPNNVLADVPPGTVPSALAGTDPLAAAQGLTRIDTSTAGAGLNVLVRYSAGNHGSILSPADQPGSTGSAETLAEMQAQMAAFVDSNGASLPISDPSVIAPVE